jgi:hypothetical protein
MSCRHRFGCIFILAFLDRPAETEGLDVRHGWYKCWEDGKTLSLPWQLRGIRSGFNSSLWTLRHGTYYLGLRATRIIRELNYAKLRAHESMHIVILWSESVNESTIDQKVF